MQFFFADLAAVVSTEEMLSECQRSWGCWGESGEKPRNMRRNAERRASIRPNLLLSHLRKLRGLSIWGFLGICQVADCFTWLDREAEMVSFREISWVVCAEQGAQSLTLLKESGRSGMIPSLPRRTCTWHFWLLWVWVWGIGVLLGFYGFSSLGDVKTSRLRGVGSVQFWQDDWMRGWTRLTVDLPRSPTICEVRLGHAGGWIRYGVWPWLISIVIEDGKRCGKVWMTWYPNTFLNVVVVEKSFAMSRHFAGQNAAAWVTRDLSRFPQHQFPSLCHIPLSHPSITPLYHLTYYSSAT